MKPINSVPHTDTKSNCKDALWLSRRDFIKLTTIVSGSLGVWLSGCAPAAEQGVDEEGPLTLVDEWFRAVNAEDVAGFDKLHSETVLATINNQREPYSGREKVWQVYRTSTGSQIEKIVAFGQDQSVCLLVNATKFNRSLCYVFNFVDGLIDRVYEYSSGQYNLATSPHFSGIEIGTDDMGLQDRLDALENVFVDGLNKRDFSVPDFFSESSMFFLPISTEPLIGGENITKDGEDYAKNFPSVSHKKIQTFGQGNLACLHVTTEGAPKGSLCFVAVFKDGKVAELYEFWSDARVDS